MNFVFFGTPKFAAIIIKKLVENSYIPKVLICNPDRPVGRKKIITPPLTKQLVLTKKYPIKIIQPESLKNLSPLDPNSILTILSSHKIDYAIVAAYNIIIPKELIKFFRLGVIGVHPSLLPKYRGPSPIQAAILNGDAKTGVTLYLIDEKVDHGPVLSQIKVKIENETYEKLEKKLALAAAKLLLETLSLFEQGKINSAVQNEDNATITKKFISADGFIKEKELEEAESGNNPEKAKIIGQKIRALNPEPGTWTNKNGKRMKILETKISSEKLVLKKIQFEGKKPTVL
ncbi:MAG: methionyl-tRNA formyltransferase [Candidatus Paceibacterota bacterium]|jgi:methionyl-tRNA formyltransferase